MEVRSKAGLVLYVVYQIPVVIWLLPIIISMTPLWGSVVVYGLFVKVLEKIFGNRKHEKKKHS